MNGRIAEIGGVQMGGIDINMLREGVAYVDHWVAYQQDRRDLPGVVVAIQCDDQLVFAFCLELRPSVDVGFTTN